MMKKVLLYIACMGILVSVYFSSQEVQADRVQSKEFKKIIAPKPSHQIEKRQVLIKLRDFQKLGKKVRCLLAF
mgnify:CR=1 FL=1